MYRVDILIVRYVRKGLNTINIEIAAAVRNDYDKLSYLPGGRNSHLITWKEVALDLETVICYAVATRPDFDVNNGTKGICFNRVSFVIPFKQTLF